MWNTAQVLPREVHVVPEDDLVGHEPTEECPCVPRTLPDENGWVIVHHAWDGRSS